MVKVTNKLVSVHIAVLFSPSSLASRRVRGTCDKGKEETLFSDGHVLIYCMGESVGRRVSTSITP